MPKRVHRGPVTRPVSFRMPVGVHRDLLAVADSRGADLSAVLNWICADALPVLLREKAEREAAIAQARAA